MEVKVLLDNVEKIKRFVGITKNASCDIDLIARNNVYLDGKSIMGILSCNIKEPLTIKINAEDSEKDDLLDQLEEYIVNA